MKELINTYFQFSNGQFLPTDKLEELYQEIARKVLEEKKSSSSPTLTCILGGSAVGKSTWIQHQRRSEGQLCQHTDQNTVFLSNRSIGGLIPEIYNGLQVVNEEKLSLKDFERYAYVESGLEEFLLYFYQRLGKDAMDRGLSVVIDNQGMHEEALCVIAEDARMAKISSQAIGFFADLELYQERSQSRKSTRYDYFPEHIKRHILCAASFTAWEKYAVEGDNEMSMSVPNHVLSLPVSFDRLNIYHNGERSQVPTFQSDSGFVHTLSAQRSSNGSAEIEIRDPKTYRILQKVASTAIELVPDENNLEAITNFNRTWRSYRDNERLDPPVIKPDYLQESGCLYEHPLRAAELACSLNFNRIR